MIWNGEPLPAGVFSRAGPTTSGETRSGGSRATVSGESEGSGRTTSGKGLAGPGLLKFPSSVSPFDWNFSRQFCRADVHIHISRVERDEQKSDRILPFHECSVITLPQCVGDDPALNGTGSS